MKKENITYITHLKTVITALMLFIFSVNTVFAQKSNDDILNEVYNKGKSFSIHIKNGDFEHLSNKKPPKGTWTYSKLIEYKKNIGSKDIFYGSIIIPTNDETMYSYNLFAYDLKKEFYYFVAIVSYKIDNKSIKFDNGFLFTEKEIITNWWKNIAEFYRSKKIEKIPESYKLRFCPPPP
ncbi:hypothetical protein ACSIGC_02995 [Tenacibaculum sp. ZS6-P6]|uniref:hypothetical protein n=1 Tax=Tenacibaculum sp. ZS6-P6 TaxID=3447503 RepID=UPI003F9E4050